MEGKFWTAWMREIREREIKEERKEAPLTLKGEC